MEKFPVIEEHQVVLMRADSRTGVVLDEDFRIVINDSQKVYTILESFDIATSLIGTLKAEHSEAEFVIYKGDQTVLEFTQ